jgi:hypothetical protein
MDDTYGGRIGVTGDTYWKISGVTGDTYHG